MATASAQEITQLLKAWGGGDKTALDELTRLCYEELRRIARRHLRRVHPGAGTGERNFRFGARLSF